MRIAAPLSRVDEVELLASAGADELYCGVLSSDWEGRFGILTANRRVYGNLSSLEELARVVDRAHSLGKAVSLTLNAQHYSSEQCEYILGFAHSLEEMELDAVIVSDVGLLARLSRERLNFRIHVSSLASCQNRAAASFLEELGAARVILPRHVRLSEIARMASRASPLEMEVFILNDGCVFEEGACHTLHLPPQMGGPLCLDRYVFEYVRADGRALESGERSLVEAHEQAYRSWLWFNFGCGFGATDEGLPYGPCGLCAIPFLMRAGVTAVKVVGREANTQRKLRSVQMVRAVIERSALVGEDDVKAFAQGLRKKPEYCRSGYMCYYRDVLDPRGARM